MKIFDSTRYIFRHSTIRAEASHVHSRGNCWDVYVLQGELRRTNLELCYWNFLAWLFLCGLIDVMGSDFISVWFNRCDASSQYHFEYVLFYYMVCCLGHVRCKAWPMSWHVFRLFATTVKRHHPCFLNSYIINLAFSHFPMQFGSWFEQCVQNVALPSWHYCELHNS